MFVVELNRLLRMGEFQGYTKNLEDYLPFLLSPENSMFIFRSQAERDIRYKQLIPYVVLRFGDSVFSYIRGKKSSEVRLTAMRSIGVGGHIEPVDQSLFLSDREMYLEAARREVKEEVHCDSAYIESVVALINDDSTEVGRVHLGIMHIWDLAEPRVTKREGLITQAGFVKLESLKANLNELETWSQIAIRVLDDPHVAKWKDPVAMP